MKAVFLIGGILAMLILAGVAMVTQRVDVAQGICLSYDAPAKSLILRNELDSQEIVFDLAEAQVGILPRQGDVVRVAYHRAGQKNAARRVMNVTRLDIRK
jgi:hypothetical protein